MTQKPCAICEELFTPYKVTTKACSEQCKEAYAVYLEREKRIKKREAAPKRTIECTICGITFTPARSDTKCCSKPCRQKQGERKRKERMNDPEYREKRLESSRQFAKRHPERVKGWRDRSAPRRRILAQMRLYGVTQPQAEFLLSIKKCDMCGKEEDPSVRYGELSTDHCHETGNIRGRLCHSCNRGLGLLGDTEERLMKALAYIQKDLVWPEEIQNKI